MLWISVWRISLRATETDYILILLVSEEDWEKVLIRASATLFPKDEDERQMEQDLLRLQELAVERHEHLGWQFFPDIMKTFTSLPFYSADNSEI